MRNHLQKLHISKFCPLPMSINRVFSKNCSNCLDGAWNNFAMHVLIQRRTKTRQSLPHSLLVGPTDVCGRRPSKGERRTSTFEAGNRVFFRFCTYIYIFLHYYLLLGVSREEPKPRLVTVSTALDVIDSALDPS